ncbi:hypothetical protein KQX54_015959 [Cotesia glomerata]|uniref:Uncharacterized protein n=1 Tax=Cotesia glomerata TaxID=32391 RepID=A0AAV7HZ46_COTGL|nr:hypothetical protein KQX54_015959 [Cotesia glomerata]
MKSRSSTSSSKTQKESSPLKSKSLQVVKGRNAKKNIQKNKYETLEEGPLNYREFLESLESLFDVKKPLKSLESLYKTYLGAEDSSSDTTISECSSEYFNQNFFPHFRPIKDQLNIQNFQVTTQYDFNQFDDSSLNSVEENNLVMAEEINRQTETTFNIEDETLPALSSEIMSEHLNTTEDLQQDSEILDDQFDASEKLQSTKILDDEFDTTKEIQDEGKVNQSKEGLSVKEQSIKDGKSKDALQSGITSFSSFEPSRTVSNYTKKGSSKSVVEDTKTPKEEINNKDGNIKHENSKISSCSAITSFSSFQMSERGSNDTSTSSFKFVHHVNPSKEDIKPLVGVRYAEGEDNSMGMMDSKMIKEIGEAYEQLASLQAEIDQLRKELEQLQCKEDLTDKEKYILEKKSRDVIKKTAELDALTKKIQKVLEVTDPASIDGYVQALGLISQSEDIKEDEKVKVQFRKNWEATSQDECFELPQQEYPEDKLPRIIVCGNTEERIPRIIVADSKKKFNNTNIEYLEKIAVKFSDALNVQEKLARENAQLEGGKFKLEQALIERDDVVEDLQRTVCNLQAEMRMVMKKNTELSYQVATLNEQVVNYSCPGSFQNSPRSANYQTSPRYNNSNYCPSNTERSRLGGGGSGHDICSQLGCCRPGMSPVSMTELRFKRGDCPAELGNKLFDCETNTQQLEEQLGSIEQNVQTIKKELATVTREKIQLEQQRKLLRCTAPCAPCPCPNQGDVRGSPSDRGVLKPLPEEIPFPKMATGIPSCTGVCTHAPMGGSNCPLQQLRDLREQYARLKEDYNNKLREVSYLRTDAEKMKQETRDAKDEKEKAENQLIDLQERLKCFESDRNRYVGSKEQMVEQEQTVIVARQRYREAQEELEELRSMIQDQANQLEDYRNKYLQAQEQVEDQRRQLELMEMDNARMNENVTLELGRVKNQFQEKLAELAPLPDILKQTQLKLQECQQMRLLAERNCEELSRELMHCKDKIGAITSQSEMLRSENVLLKGSDQQEDLENRNRELKNENERLKNACARSEERENEYKQRIEEKLHEIAQLSSMLEQVREDSARQVARTKERCETIRRSMQAQIGDLEKQLAQCRATTKAAQRDKDEIRQKMQGQINHLSEAFEQAQCRIRTLQGQVSYLNTSYSNVFNVGARVDTPGPSIPIENSPNLYDTCNCNY